MHTQNLSRLFRRLSITGCLSLIPALLVLAVPLAKAEESWQERLSANGITVRARPYQDSRHQEFNASVIVEAGTAAVLAVLQDNSACTSWLYRCVESRLLNQVSNSERFFYQVTDLPFPARSRDAVFHARLSYQEDGSILVRMSAVQGHVPPGRFVRITSAEGYYLLEPVDDRKTRVTWQQFIDPAGALPAWLVNSMMTDLPYRSLLRLQELVTTEPYADAAFSYDESGTPSGIVTEP